MGPTSTRTRIDPAGIHAPIPRLGTAPPSVSRLRLPPVSWPAEGRPSMSYGAATDKVVDGRHKAGHDTGGAVQPNHSPWTKSQLACDTRNEGEGARQQHTSRPCL